jgi:hypothetical protein
VNPKAGLDLSGNPTVYGFSISYWTIYRKALVRHERSRGSRLVKILTNREKISAHKRLKFKITKEELTNLIRWIDCLQCIYRTDADGNEQPILDKAVFKEKVLPILYRKKCISSACHRHPFGGAHNLEEVFAHYINLKEPDKSRILVSPLANRARWSEKTTIEAVGILEKKCSQCHLGPSYATRKTKKDWEKCIEKMQKKQPIVYRAGLFKGGQRVGRVKLLTTEEKELLISFLSKLTESKYISCPGVWQENSEEYQTVKDWLIKAGETYQGIKNPKEAYKTKCSKCHSLERIERGRIRIKNNGERLLDVCYVNILTR